MGPLDLMYSWQALLAAAACVGVVKLVKTIIDVAKGAQWRKERPWISKLLLPLTAIMAGALYASFVPFWPETLSTYVSQLDGDGWFLPTMAHVAWGAAVGQFSTMIHGKLKDFIETARPKA